VVECRRQACRLFRSIPIRRPSLPPVARRLMGRTRAGALGRRLPKCHWPTYPFARIIPPNFIASPLHCLVLRLRPGIGTRRRLTGGNLRLRAVGWRRRSSASGTTGHPQCDP
jgi:hypothetical protein